jgi:hypothetical protein
MSLRPAEEEHGDVDGDNTSSLRDDDSPQWAQRSAFPQGELSRVSRRVATCIPSVPLAHLTQSNISKYCIVWPTAASRTTSL